MNVASWIVGLSLIVLTITLHTTVVVMMAFGMESRIRARIEKHTLVPQKAIPAVIGSIGFVAVALALMHGLEGCSGRRHTGRSAHSTRSPTHRSIHWEP